MEGEIDAFSPTYLDRITQLTNKTNQFNLTTRRYALAEMQAIAADANYLTLYGRLKDAFGDNGLVSVVVGRQVEHTLELDLWLMSCRVLKRGMEEAMFDVLVERARARGVTRLLGTYIASGRNQMVEHHYRDLGFTPLPQDDPQRSTWTLDISDAIPRRNLHIHLVRQ
jgi:FkbH-like protein